MVQTYRIYTPPGSLFAFAPLVVSEYADVSVEIVSDKDIVEEIIESKSPTGKAPLLETQKGDVIVSSQAISRFIASLRRDTELFGKGSIEDTVAIDDWTNWAAQELELPVCLSYYMTTGVMRFGEDNMAKTKKDIECALAVLESKFQNAHTYLVLPDQVTVADIVISCYLVYPFTLVFSEAELKEFPKVKTWFENCMQQPEFISVLGKIECGKK